MTTTAVPVRSIVFLAIGGFAAQAMVRVTDSLLPQMADDFGVTVGAVSIVVTAYGLGHGASQLFLGLGGDRLGKYRAIAICCVLASVLVFACALMPNLESLAVVRVLSGVVAGWIIPLGMAYVGDVTPYDQRQTVLGRYLTGNIGGLLFGQVAGGILGDLFGWRMMFVLLAGLLAIAAACVIYELSVNPVARQAPPPDHRSRGLIAGFGAVLSVRWARIVLLAVFIEGAAFWGTFAYIGADLRARFDLSYTVIGLIVATLALGGLTYVVTVKHLVRHLGQRGLTLAGGGIMAVSYFVLAAGIDWRLAPVAVSAAGLGLYMMHNTLQTHATQMTPHARGIALALFSSALYISQSLGVAISSFVIDRVGGGPLYAAAGLVLPGLGFWFAWELHQREREAPLPG